MPNSSNATFLVQVGDPEAGIKGIYKPLRGERPLWDFPAGLYKREVAAYLLSESLGYHLVPPTVMRDGPLGEGSLQLFIDYDPEEHYLMNNTDRKGGHVLLDSDGAIWGIDHGVCFSDDFKLRTVIWDFAGQTIADSFLSPLESLMQSVPIAVAALLSDNEIEAMLERTEWLLENRVFPTPESRYQYPWPLL